MARTLSSLQRMARISTIEVDVEVNFEDGQNIHIFFFKGIFFGGGVGGGQNLVLLYDFLFVPL